MMSSPRHGAGISAVSLRWPSVAVRVPRVVLSANTSSTSDRGPGGLRFTTSTSDPAVVSRIVHRRCIPPTVFPPDSGIVPGHSVVKPRINRNQPQGIPDGTT